MEYFEVSLIGRESVKSVNATFLATLIKDLVKTDEKNEKNCKYLMKCKEKLELMPRKKKKIREDEGFESEEEDDDRSLISNEDAQSTSSSCFLVDDHVFKSQEIYPEKKVPDRTPSSIGSTDSANSSGSSDTDEIDSHMSVQRNERSPEFFKSEQFPVGDVIFCHTDLRFPSIIAWVIKKSNIDFGTEYRLGKTGVESIRNSEKCLEVIVVKCRNIENMKELCQNYKEYSKRLKLDQYQSRKAEDKKVSLADLKVTNSSLMKASEMSILQPKLISSFKSSSLLNVTNKTLGNRDAETVPEAHHTKLTNSVSLNSLLSDKKELHQYESNKKELNITKTQSLSNISGRMVKQITKANQKMDFNLIQRTDLNGVTHIEISRDNRDNNIATNKSKIRKEIEGVILTDVDSYVKKETVRQRQVSNDKESRNEVPPIRPERRRFIRKNKPLEQQTLPSLEEQSSRSRFYLNDTLKKEQKVIKGQFVRAESNPWAPQPVHNNLGSWKGEEPKRSEVRRRSKSVDRLKILPKKAPMAYRYIDVTDSVSSNVNNNKFFGLPQKIRQISGTRPRRNSFDDSITNNKTNGNLKSVIKKNKKVNNGEPKKVTFSAFATVQVVD